MNIYFLTPNDEVGFVTANWQAHTRFIIRAETDENARQMAAKESGFTIWENPKIVSSIPLTHEGDAGILLADFKNGYNRLLVK